MMMSKASGMDHDTAYATIPSLGGINRSIRAVIFRIIRLNIGHITEITIRRRSSISL